MSNGNYTNFEVEHLANTIYGEAGGEDYDTMLMVGSTAINRLNAGRIEEFGDNLIHVLNKGYYATGGIKDTSPSPMYMQAFEKKFPDKASENQYKIALQIASGLLKGTIKPVEGMFYFDKKEAKKQKAAGFKFDEVREVGKQNKFTIYSY